MKPRWKKNPKWLWHVGDESAHSVATGMNGCMVDRCGRTETGAAHQAHENQSVACTISAGVRLQVLIARLQTAWQIEISRRILQVYPRNEMLRTNLLKCFDTNAPDRKRNGEKKISKKSHLLSLTVAMREKEIGCVLCWEPMGTGSDGQPWTGGSGGCPEYIVGTLEGKAKCTPSPKNTNPQ